MTKTTIRDYNQANPLNNRPTAGVRGTDPSTGIYVPGSSGSGGTSISSDPTKGATAPAPDVESSRRGDWYFNSHGTPVVVENSYTDLAMKYTNISGGAPSQDLKWGDWINAAKGAYTGGQLGGLVLGNTGKGIGAVVGFLKTLSDAKDVYLNQYLDQEIDVTPAFNLIEHEDGTKGIIADSSKMADAGFLSGSGVKAYTDRTNSGVTLGDDGALNIKVSAAFADSDKFADIQRQLKDWFPEGLSKEEAGRVVNEDTGDTMLDQIGDYITGEESSFYYNATSIAEFKRIAPDASDEALQQAVNTQLAGSLTKDDDLKKLDIAVYDRDNNKKEINAAEYLDSILEMSKEERNDYMSSIGSRIQSADISDDEKAILQAQANALYSASNQSKTKYSGMYMDGFWDSIADAQVPFFGRVGNIFGISPDLETFEANEFYSNLISVVSFAGEVAAQQKISGLLEKGVRAGTSGLGKMIGDNKVGNFLNKIDDVAPSGKRIVRAAGETYGSVAARRAAQYAMNAIADVGYDGVEYLAHKATGQDYDFLDNLTTDLMMDALVTYGPGTFVSVMNADKGYYKTVKNKKTGKYEVVELTAKELEARKAAAANKILDSKATLTTLEVFFDKNIALQKIALIARAIAPDGQTNFRERLRLLGDIRQATADIKSEWENSEGVSENWKALQGAIHEATGGKARNFNQADADYMNAKINRARFVKEAGSDKGKRMKAVKFYKDAINGVSKERAKQLDNILNAMKPLTRNALDFYKANGMISDELYTKLTTPEVDKKTGKPIEGSSPADNYLPVWTAAQRSDGGDILQSRTALKSFENKEKMYKVEEFENPLNTFATYINNVMRNVAIQRRAELIIETANNPNSSIKIASQSKGAGVMDDYALLVEYSPEFERIRDNIVKKIEKNFPTEEEWKQDNVNAYEKSEVRMSLSELNSLRKEQAELANSLKKLRSESRKAFYEENWGEEEIRRYQEDVDYLKFQINMNKQSQAELKERIFDETLTLMTRQQAKNPLAKSKEFTLDDPAAYAEMYVRPSIEEAFKSNNPEGALAVLISASIEAVNPYLVSKEDMIEKSSKAAAVKFRKKLIAAERKKGTDKNKIAAKVDEVLDKLVQRHRGKNAGKVDEGNMASFLTTYDEDAPRTIRFYVNGEEHHIELEGAGAEALVAEFYAPEAVIHSKGWEMALAPVRGLAKVKRGLTTATVPARVIPNLLRDWTRGIITTGGRILLDPDCLRTDAINSGKYTEEEIKQINDAFLLVRQAISKSTFTQSLEGPRKNIYRQMIRTSEEGMQDTTFAQERLARKDMTFKEKLATTKGYLKSGYIHYKSELKGKSVMELFSTLQDVAESYTRKRAMDTAYYSELAAATARGESTDAAIKAATEAAYFYGREATTNFARRGRLIGAVAQYVPYLSQKFSSLESLALAYIDNPVGVANSMRTCLGAYTTLIAMALSNEESRKRYFLLTEEERMSNVIIPLTNDTIVTIPLDDNIAAFFTPYREMVETLYGVDKKAFYLWALDGLADLSPLDLSGFSEGDKFNLSRGLEKMSSELIPTALLPFIETWAGHTMYYGNEIRVDEDSPWLQSDNPNPTAGDLTKSSKDSAFLATIANSTGIPQWQLQEFVEVYGSTVGQYALNVIDNVYTGVTGKDKDKIGGKGMVDDIFKPLTGADSDAASNALWDGVERLKVERKSVERKIQSINNKLEASTGEEKAKLLEEKQKIIRDYGLRVSEFLDSYAQAYSITGGLTQKEANSIWYLYDVYDSSRASKNAFTDSTVEEYYNEKVKDAISGKTNALAARSGFDKYYNTAIGSYNETYGYRALKDSVKGYGTKTMAKIATALEDTSDYDNSFVKLKKDAKKKMDAAFDSGDYDTYNALAYQYDMMVLKAVLPYLQEDGLEESLKNYTVMDYLEDWIYVPTDEMVDAKGRWLSKLPEGAEKSKAYKKRFILKAYGLLED